MASLFNGSGKMFFVFWRKKKREFVFLLAVWKNKFETLTNKEYNRAGQACGFYCFFRADLPFFINFFIFYYLPKSGLS
ncbi:hypothetical protein EFY79_16780 [Hanamia caeni]|uniref:Uncharacterized protein n=1 Tax=Hanamia caeni TaxID=2294116 RepID=A0A3M9N818_9BACT|nr:hypothetical protein EFY79_16780 [Hanamia caeni]